MKKDSENLVKKVASATEMGDLTVDKINELAPKAPDMEELRLTAKQKASQEGVRWIEPKRKLQAIGKLPEKLREEHARAWEYVKGIYENFVVNGEPVEFWHCHYPGDPDCLWVIPSNVPVYVPRMIAKHLEETQKYHTFGAIAPTSDPTPRPAHEVEAMRWFAPTGTHYRGKFRAIGSFS